MSWVRVSYRSCSCWLSLAAKNIINLISVLTIWWCPCVQSSLVLLDESVCYDQCIFLAKLYYPLPCFILYSKAKFACYPRCFLTSYFCIPAPCYEKDIFFWVLVLKGLVGLHRTVQLQLLQRYWLPYERLKQFFLFFLWKAPNAKVNWKTVNTCLTQSQQSLMFVLLGTSLSLIPFSLYIRVRVYVVYIF